MNEKARIDRLIRKPKKKRRKKPPTKRRTKVSIPFMNPMRKTQQTTRLILPTRLPSPQARLGRLGRLHPSQTPSRRIADSNNTPTASQVHGTERLSLASLDRLFHFPHHGFESYTPLAILFQPGLHFISDVLHTPE